MAVPKLDAPLASYSTNFYTRALADAGAYQLSIEQVELYGTLHGAFIAAYNAASAEGAKSRALVAAKDSAKAALLPYARQLYFIVQSSRDVSDANKILIGVTPRRYNPSPISPPELSPMLTVLSVRGRIVNCKVQDRTAPNTRRRPANASGLMVMSYVGENPPPVGSSGWKMERQTGRTAFVVEFHNDVAAGAACWLTGMWYSRRGQYSPACEPVRTYLQVGPAVAA